jgi:hypothetical protein
MPDPSERPTNAETLPVVDQAEADRLIRERVNPKAEDLALFPEFQGARLVDVRLRVSAMVMRVNFSRSELDRVGFDGSNLDDAVLTGRG